jgi:hypothetical protein
MLSLYWRGGSPDRPCSEHEKLKVVAEELVSALSSATSLEQFTQAQQSLLFLFHELHQRMDPLHPRFPGGHRCLVHCYLEYATLIRAKALLLIPQPPDPPAPPPTPQPLSDEELMAYVERWAKENARETFFGSVADGEDQHDTSTP